jgi:hypothetical protein
MADIRRLSIVSPEFAAVNSPYPFARLAKNPTISRRVAPPSGERPADAGLE